MPPHSPEVDMRGVFMLALASLVVTSSFAQIGNPRGTYDPTRPVDRFYDLEELKGSYPKINRNGRTQNPPAAARKELKAGERALGAGDLDPAQKHFKKALELYPSYSGAHCGLGIIAQMRGDLNAAQEAFSAAVHANPWNTTASRNLGLVLLSKNNVQYANMMFRTTWNTDPEDDLALVMLVYTELKIGNLDRARNFSEKLGTRQMKNQPLGHYVKALVLQADEKGDKAAEEFREYLRLQPDSPFSENARANLAKLEGK